MDNLEIYYKSNDYLHEVAVENASRLALIIQSEQERADQWLPTVIETGCSNPDTFTGKRINPQAFSNYLLKNGFIKYN